MESEKTPVTMLNEMMSKIKSTPVYELCPTELNIAPFTFTYKVICNGITSWGSGRSKKDAKQNAAYAMLEKLHQSSVVPVISIDKQNDQTRDVSLQDNTIQELQRLCAKYRLTDAMFEDLESTGPPHARIYQVKCTVSKLEAIGIGKTKKQAKHQAASSIIEKIHSFYNVSNLSHGNKNEKKQSEFNNNDMLNDSQIANKSGSTKMKINFDLKMQSEKKELAKNHGALARLDPAKLDHITALIRECQANIDENNIIELKQEFQTLLESVNIDFHHMLLQTSESTVTFMLIIQLNTIPDLLEMSLGSTREEAELRTINKVIEAIKSFLT